MDLEPVYAAGSEPAAAAARPPGTVELNSYRQQLIGIRTVRLNRQSGLQTIHAVGKVAVDETRVDRVSALADGVVRSVSALGTGSMVRQDDVLATYFVASRDIYNAMQAFVLASGTFDQAASAVRAGLINSSKANSRTDEELLKSYGVTAAQIRDLARTREVTRDIDFRAPISGLILARNVSRDQVVTRGTELFRIADLSHVWILAEVFENDVHHFHSGAMATVSYAGRSYPARVSDARQFNVVSRTLEIRLEIDNPGLILRPDMFVDVQVEEKMPAGLSVPVESILDTGHSRVVFVTGREGVFEPRQVSLGAEYGDRVQVLQGLKEGDSIVTAGMFLLDSESRLRNPGREAAMAGASTETAPQHHAATAGMIDPVCGMPLSASKNETATYQGVTLHFCSLQCKSKFERNTARYLKKRVAVS